MRHSFRSVTGLLGSCFAAAVLIACSGDGDSSDGGSGGGGNVPAGSGGGPATAGAKSVAGGGAAVGGKASSGGPNTPTAGATSSGAGGGGGSTSSAGSPASAGTATSTAGQSGSGTGTGGAGAGGTAGAKSTGGASSGGGSKSMGGASGAVGNAGSGGSAGSAGSKSAGGTGGVPAVGPGPCGCEDPAGEFGTVNSTIVVGKGQVYDGKCQIYRANPDTLGAGDQEEGQLPIFRVEDGATLRNVVIGASGADGVHLYGDVTLENIHWLDIGEDAMTVKESGTVRLNCGSAAHGDDKVFQVNAASEIFISNFTGTDAGKFMRQNGDTTFKVTVTIDHCDISDMGEVIFRTDSSTSHVTLTNTRYSKLGDGLFMFGDDVVNGNSNQSTVSNNKEY